MNKLALYHLGSFIQEVEAANESHDVFAKIAAVDKFLPNAIEIEREAFESLKEELENGDTAARVAQS